MEHKEHANGEVVLEIPDKFDQASHKGYYIYKIPENLYSLNKQAYTPQVVSIGPFFHKDPSLSAMEKQKSIYMESFLNRTSRKLEDFKEFIRAQEEKTRGCYSEPFDEIETDKWVNMIMLDSLFILEMFIRNNDKENPKYEDDGMLHNKWRMNCVMYDLIREENQLPYSDLNRLYEFAFRGSDDPHKNISFSYITLKYFWKLKLELDKEFQVLNFCDLYRVGVLNHIPPPPAGYTEDSKGFVKLKRAANKLNDSGIRFKKFLGNKEKLSFSSNWYRGVLKMPALHIEDSTEVIFRNIMALEQLICPETAYVSSYVWFVDSLINSDVDVALLVKNGIIVHSLGSSKEVAEVVNCLPKNVFCPDVYHQAVCKEMNEFCDGWLHRCVAILNGEYFKDVWHGTGTCVFLIVLVLTFINSVWNVMRIFGLRQ